MRRCFGCTDLANPAFAVLSRAAARSASARLRKLGILRVAPDWQRRLASCANCPLRTVVNGVAHCGRPLLRQVHRRPDQGCGCPIEAKARTPGEHCPLTAVLTAGPDSEGRCDCKWCRMN